MIKYPNTLRSSFLTDQIAGLSYGKNGDAKNSEVFNLCIPTSYLWNTSSKISPIVFSSVNSDRMTTGKRGFMGDHSCDHYHVDGTIYPLSGSLQPVIKVPEYWNPKMDDPLHSIHHKTLLNDYGICTPNGPIWALIPDYKTRYHVVSVEDSEYKTGKDAEYYSKYTSRSNFIDLVPVARAYGSFSYVIRYQSCHYEFRFHDGKWHCTWADRHNAIYTLILKYPSCEVYTYVRCPEYKDSRERHFFCQTGSYIWSWLGYWESASDPCKYLTPHDVELEMMEEIPSDLLTFYSGLERDLTYAPLWADLKSMTPNRSFKSMSLVTERSARHTDMRVTINPIDNGTIAKAYALSNAYERYMDDKFSPSPLQHAELAQELADNGHTVDINSLAFVQDLVGSKEEILRLKDLVLQLSKTIAGRNPLGSARAMASGFLSYKYGVRLTVSDLWELIEGIKQSFQNSGQFGVNGYFTARTRHVYPLVVPDKNVSAAIRQFNYKMYYRASSIPLTRALKNLQDWDVWPTLENCWDLIPFSFVVDWFISVGDFLKAIDDENYLSSLDVGGVVWTTKDVFDLTNTCLGPTASFVGGKVICYRRHLTSSLPHIPPQISLSGKFNQHYFEAGALIVQHR